MALMSGGGQVGWFDAKYRGGDLEKHRYERHRTRAPTDSIVKGRHTTRAHERQLLD